MKRRENMKVISRPRTLSPILGSGGKNEKTDIRAQGVLISSFEHGMEGFLRPELTTEMR